MASSKRTLTVVFNETDPASVKATVEGLGGLTEQQRVALRTFFMRPVSVWPRDRAGSVSPPAEQIGPAKAPGSRRRALPSGLAGGMGGGEPVARTGPPSPETDAAASMAAMFGKAAAAAQGGGATAARGGAPAAAEVQKHPSAAAVKAETQGQSAATAASVPEAAGLRKTLLGLKMSSLRRRAESAEGVTERDLDDAEDAADTKAKLSDLIIAKEAEAGWRSVGCSWLGRKGLRLFVGHSVAVGTIMNYKPAVEKDDTVLWKVQYADDCEELDIHEIKEFTKVFDDPAEKAKVHRMHELMNDMQKVANERTAAFVKRCDGLYGDGSPLSAPDLFKDTDAILVWTKFGKT